MNWYKKIQAAIISIDQIEKSINGTLTNMIPNIYKIDTYKKFVNQREHEKRKNYLETIVVFKSSNYPIVYNLYITSYYDYDIKEFDTSEKSEGILFDIVIGIDKEKTEYLLSRSPENKYRINSLIEEMSIGNYKGSSDVIYMNNTASLYHSAIDSLDFVHYFESLIGGGGGNDGDDEDPWFPGDPSANWEFEQEENMLAPVPVTVPNNYQQKSMSY